MSREALIERGHFLADAKPVQGMSPAADRPHFPAPRQLDLPFRVHASYAAALLVFLVSVSALAIGSERMPIVFTVCAFFFMMYFGVMTLMSRIPTGEPRQRDTYDAKGIMTSSGPLTARQASAQVLTLPFLVAGFGIFALIAGQIIF